MVVNQVVFILLTFTLLQIFLLRTQKKQKNLANKPMPQIKKELYSTDKRVVVYYKGRFGVFRQYKFMEILLTLEGTARTKALKKTRSLRAKQRELLEIPSPFC